MATFRRDGHPNVGGILIIDGDARAFSTNTEGLAGAKGVFVPLSEAGVPPFSGTLVGSLIEVEVGQVTPSGEMGPVELRRVRYAIGYD